MSDLGILMVLADLLGWRLADPKEPHVQLQGRWFWTASRSLVSPDSGAKSHAYWNPLENLDHARECALLLPEDKQEAFVENLGRLSGVTPGCSNAIFIRAAFKAHVADARTVCLAIVAALGRGSLATGGRL